jgi:hypothetical protein
LYPASCKNWSSSSVPFLQTSRVGATKSMSSTCWRIVQSFGQQLSKSLAKVSPKIVGEFLEPCGSLVQINCPFVPVSGSSHMNTNRGWLASCHRQKKAYLKSRHVNALAVGGIKLSRVYGLGTTG